MRKYQRVREIVLQLRTHGLLDCASFLVGGFDFQNRGCYLEALLSAFFFESLPRQIHQADQPRSGGFIKGRPFTRLQQDWS